MFPSWLGTLLKGDTTQAGFGAVDGVRGEIRSVGLVSDWQQSVMQQAKLSFIQSSGVLKLSCASIVRILDNPPSISLS